MRIIKWPVLVAAAWLCGAWQPASACDTPKGPSPAYQAALARLQQAGLNREDDDTDVSAGERTALVGYKQALGDAVEEHMACMPVASDPSTLERDLATALAASTSDKPVEVPESDNAPALGAGLRVAVSRIPATSGLVLIQVRFGIPCGDDNLLLGYRQEQGHWKRVLRWQSGDYETISGALGSPFTFLALPGGQVVVAHGTTWCTSRWSNFDLDVLMPGQDATPQRSLLHSEGGYATDDGLALKSRPDGFELRMQVGMLDLDVMNRQGIYRYQVNNDQIRRVQPAARNGRDFVDEWLQIEEPLALAWSDPAATAEVTKARQEILAGTKDHAWQVSYGAVRACKGKPRQYQVEIDPTASETKAAKPSSYYALLRQDADGFTMLHLKTKADSACDGPDLMSH